VSRLLALLAVMAAPSPQAVPRLAPSTKWSVDYADAKCTLSRTFGTGADRLIFSVATMPGRQFVDVVVLEPDASGSGSRRIKLTLPSVSATPIELSGAGGGALPKGGRVTRGFMPRDRADALRRASSVELAIDRRRVELPLTGVAAAFKALDSCEADLMKHWGLDPQILTRVVTPATPLGSPAQWVTDDDYPSGPLWRREQGVVTFRLDIDTAGRTSNCAVVISSRFKELDDTVCANMLRRTRFNPARDANGRPVASIFISRFTWRIP
jgi:TonB family protein